MIESNPFAAVPAFAMQIYVLAMVAAVIVGTLVDVWHKGSGTYFAQRRERSRALAKRQLGAGTAVSLALATAAEAAVSGEFDKWPRRAAHLLTMYGFLLHAITTAAMVFAYPGGVATPAMLPALWTLGGLMVLAGGLWFFFFLRVNVAYDGDSPFHLGRADLFVGSLIASVAFALLWHLVQSASGVSTASWVVFGVYLFFTTLLFVTVPWSKFAHMFFKPAVAYQRRVEEADGSSDLPSPSTENFIGTYGTGR
jgi:hypothetical protein